VIPPLAAAALRRRQAPPERGEERNRLPREARPRRRHWQIIN